MSSAPPKRREAKPLRKFELNTDNARNWEEKGWEGDHLAVLRNDTDDLQIMFDMKGSDEDIFDIPKVSFGRNQVVIEYGQEHPKEPRLKFHKVYIKHSAISDGKIVFAVGGAASVYNVAAGFDVSTYRRVLTEVYHPKIRHPSGRVLYQDNFSDPLLKGLLLEVGTPVGGYVRRDTTKALTDGASLCISSGTGVVGGHGITFAFGTLQNMKVGLEFDFLMEDSVRHRFEAYLYYWDGAKSHRGELKYNPLTFLWSLAPSINLYTYRPYAGLFTWHHAKFKVDLINNKYLGDAIVDHNLLNVDGRACQVVTSTGIAQTLRVSLLWYNAASFVNDQRVWIDNVVITTEEEA